MKRSRHWKPTRNDRLEVSFCQVVFLIILSSLWGCSLVKYPTSRPSLPPTDLPRLTRQSNQQIRSIRGIGRIEIVSGGQRIRGRQFIALVKPAMVRIDFLNFLNQPLLLLASSGDKFQAMDMLENRFYRGAVSDGLTHFIHLGVSSEEFVSLILGEIPSQGDVSVRYDPRRHLYQVTFPSAAEQWALTFWIHPKTLKVVEVSKIDRLKREEIRVVFSQFKETGSGTFPREIRIDAPSAGSKIWLSFRKVEINPSLSPDLFRLSIPPGVEIIEVDDSSEPLPPPLPMQEYGKD